MFFVEKVTKKLKRILQTDRIRSFGYATVWRTKNLAKKLYPPLPCGGSADRNGYYRQMYYVEALSQRREPIFIAPDAVRDGVSVLILVMRDSKINSDLQETGTLAITHIFAAGAAWSTACTLCRI
jgi:hypothetical protein